VGGGSEMFSMREFAVNDDETSGHAVGESLEYRVLWKSVLKVRISVLLILVVY
jgi:hypothetical protein